MAPELARRLCDVRYGIGSDGVVEVVEANGAQAEIVIWNPDGSVAEFSGNGSRIAAAWLGARAGTAQVTIGVAGRTYPAAIRDDGTVAMGVGEVEVGETETIELGDERIELTAVSVGNPHAVVRLDASRDDLLRLGPLIERARALPRADERPARPRRRSERAVRARLGARSGGDERLRLERGRRCGRGGRERLVREPGHRPHAGRRAAGRARRRGADHARRSSRGDLRGRAPRLDRELELAQGLVQAQPLVVRLLAPADDQRAVELIRPGGELLRTRARDDDGARRHGAAVLDGLRRP